MGISSAFMPTLAFLSSFSFLAFNRLRRASISSLDNEGFASPVISGFIGGSDIISDAFVAGPTAVDVADILLGKGVRSRNERFGGGLGGDGGFAL